MRCILITLLLAACGAPNTSKVITEPVSFNGAYAGLLPDTYDCAGTQTTVTPVLVVAAIQNNDVLFGYQGCPGLEASLDGDTANILLTSCEGMEDSQALWQEYFVGGTVTATADSLVFNAQLSTEIYDYQNPLAEPYECSGVETGTLTRQ